MSQLTYNNVILPYARETSFLQDTVRDDSNTDRMYTKFDIQAEFVINSDYLSLIAPDLVKAGQGITTNPADIMDVVRSRLLQDRRQLSYKMNGVELIPQAQKGLLGTVDARNGPQPQTCRILQLNNTAFLCQYHIIAHYWENNTIGNSSPIVTNQLGNSCIGNRWTETLELDASQHSRVVHEGKCWIRSDNPEGITVDDLRETMAVVGVPGGWLRESSQYVVSPDGLSLAYRSVDKEVDFMPPVLISAGPPGSPPPTGAIYEADGDYVQTSTNMGTICWGEARVRLRGSKTTDRTALIFTALAVGMDKLKANGLNTVPGKGTSMIQSAVIRVGLFENTVDFTVRGMLKPKTTDDTKGRKRKIAGFDFVKMADTTAYSDPNSQPPYFDRGTASVFLRAAAYYDPSLTTNAIDRALGQMNNGLEPGEAGVDKEP